MSLTKVNLVSNIKRQYDYKLKSYVWVFSSLIILQSLAILFSLGGVASSGGGGSGYSLQIEYYSADMMIAFTMFWAFMIATQITSKKENEFMFVINKTSNHLSDVSFLFTTSVIGGITAIMSGFLLRVITLLFSDSVHVLQNHLLIDPKYFLMGMLATILYMFLLSSLGHIVGTLIQVNKFFMFLLPALFIGLLFIADKYGESNFMFKLFDFYFNESSLVLFIIKVILTTSLLFLGSSIITKRLEVRP